MSGLYGDTRLFRAGWSDKGNKRLGRGWAWIGPYIVGTKRGLQRWFDY